MSARRRFPSPRFTELAPTNTNAAGESPIIATPEPFDRAVLSWNGEGRWLLEARLDVGGRLTPYLPLGVLEGARARSAGRGSATDPAVAVQVDTLVVRGGAKAKAFQVRATGSGDLRSLSVAHYRRDDRRYTDRSAAPGAWGRTLDVPARAQRDVEEEPSIGGEVCSPTSIAMLLEFHGTRYRTIDVARAAYDPQGRLYGNWPCNAAAAARLLRRGWSAVVKMAGFDELEREIAAGRPVALSHRWERGDLTGAPVSRSNGHLIVAVGFTGSGDVVVNDPAARDPANVRRAYSRRELFRTWQEKGEGIAYLVHPG